MQDKKIAMVPGKKFIDKVIRKLGEFYDYLFIVEIDKRGRLDELERTL